MSEAEFRLDKQPDYLSEVDLFSGLKEKERRGFQKLGHVVHFANGHKVLTKGNPDLPSLHIIITGKVDVVNAGRTISTLGKGECFGELALIDGLPRSADVITSEPTQCFILSGFQFNEYLDKHPELAINMLKALAKKLRDCSARAELQVV
jgi:CRP/FNR family transcriptional regulator/CRP/FNR family cyclic AMP-dependent transcriptional regulator